MCTESQKCCEWLTMQCCAQHVLAIHISVGVEYSFFVSFFSTSHPSFRIPSVCLLFFVQKWTFAIGQKLDKIWLFFIAITLKSCSFWVSHWMCAGLSHTLYLCLFVYIHKRNESYVNSVQVFAGSWDEIYKFVVHTIHAQNCRFLCGGCVGRAVCVVG